MTKAFATVVLVLWLVLAIIACGIAWWSLAAVRRAEEVAKAQEEELNQLRGMVDSLNFELVKCEEKNATRTDAVRASY